MSLRVVPPPDPVPLPDGDAYLDPAPRRPGELHEAVAATAAVRGDAAAVAAAAGIAESVATTVPLEAHVVHGDLARVGRELDGSAVHGGVERRLSAAEADYLRSLTAGRRRRRGRFAAGPLLIPVRLLPWAKPSTLAMALRGDVEQALVWEAQALLAGATMREWVLLGALAS